MRNQVIFAHCFKRKQLTFHPCPFSAVPSLPPDRISFRQDMQQTWLTTLALLAEERPCLRESEILGRTTPLHCCSITFAHPDDEATPLLNKSARNQNHGSVPKTRKPPNEIPFSPRIHPLPLPDREREGAMSALDLWKSLGAKSLHCSFTGFRLVISCLLTLSTPWRG